ncbi:MAG: ABC transporter substrate-binding protein [Desulfobacterales bacterium]|nr:ABC transporter substrate-binding protein [Desulfobacterales bacterium]
MIKNNILLLGIVLFFALQSFEARAEEGITDTEIRIAQFGPLSGPAAAWGAVVKGADLLFKIVNEEGGICGKKIVYRMFDDGYNPAMTKAGVKNLQENIGIFAWVGGVGSATSLAVIDYLMNKKVLWISPFSGAKELIDPPKQYLLITFYPFYRMEAKILCKYAFETMKKKRIAIVYQDDGYGRFALEGAIDEMKRHHNAELVSKLPVEAKESQMKPYALKLKEADAEAVLLFMTPFAALRLLKAAKEMEYFPQWMGANSFSDFPLLYKISRGLWEGMITTSQADLAETPLLKKYKDAFSKYAEAGEEWSLNYQYGIGILEPFVEALKRCNCDLTRERLIKEMENLKEFKGVLNTGTFEQFNASDPKSRWVSRESSLIQCEKNGEIKQLSDWIRVDNY